MTDWHRLRHRSAQPGEFLRDPSLNCVVLCYSVAVNETETVAFSGAKLKRLRLCKGWTLRDLEQRTGINFGALAHYERDDYAPWPSKLPVMVR